MATDPNPIMCFKKGLSGSRNIALKISLGDKKIFFTDSNYVCLCNEQGLRKYSLYLLRKKTLNFNILKK